MRTIAAAALAALVVTAAAAAATGDRTQPYPLKKLVTLPEGKGWKLRVNGSVPNATAQVLAANQFNAKPKRGRQYVLVNVTASYSGSGSSTVLAAGTLAAVGKSNVSYSTSSDRCGVVPDALDTFKKVFKGGRLTGNICFAVKTSDVPTLELFYDPLFSTKDTEVFFALR